MSMRAQRSGPWAMYAAVCIGLCAALLLGSVSWNTLNFWLTAAAALIIVSALDWFLLAVLDHATLTPSQFILRMMLLVIAIQSAFAGIYYCAATDTTFLARDGRPITEFTDVLYFSGVTLLTVGYGDIVPRGEFRFTAVAEVYGGTLFLFSFFSWGMGVLASRSHRR